MKLRYPKRKALLIFSGIILFLVFLSSQSVMVTQQDETYLKLFLNDWNIHETPQEVHKSFDSELSFISKVQDSVIAQVKHKTIPHADFGNVAYYYTNKRGECFDRAVLFEKLFSYYHFSFRHVYVYFGENGKKPSAFDFFKRHLSSHALMEVKTSRGWLAVGSNSNWLGVDSSGRLLAVPEIRKELVSNQLHLRKNPTIGLPSFWELHHDFRYVYGIYSRHGDFFTHEDRNVAVSSVTPLSFHLLPDYNLRMLFYNFFN